MPYRDMREYLGVLERAGKLKRITREVDRDWELAAVTRTVFQKIPEAVRPALLFERVKGFDIPVAVGILGGSGAIYALALETEEERVWERWRDAQAHPIPPVLVPDGPCKEHVLKGEEADLRAFPHPVWTPGRDPSPYITAACVCTRDPETGQQNVGTYRVQIQEKDQAGIYINVTHGGARHISKNEAAGRPTELAIVLGADPVVGLVGVSTVATSLDELAVAGGLRGAPLEVVKGETVDLEVPADAEIVLEGHVPPHIREDEGPFSEF
ncbi:MAG: UbiD family decarboxylase, partial [Deltaproteobacteria bacterium]|nr:UbiD family decarboxylase [Deltaproteobacteria bacterium]